MKRTIVVLLSALLLMDWVRASYGDTAQQPVCRLVGER